MSGSWLAMEEVLKGVPGPLFEVNNRPTPGSQLRGGGRAADAAEDAEDDDRTTAGGADGQGAARPVTVVVFIGGCTAAEISALRWLGSRPSAPCQYVILTTNMCTGTTMLEGLVDTVVNNLATIDD